MRGGALTVFLNRSSSRFPRILISFWMCLASNFSACFPASGEAAPVFCVGSEESASAWLPKYFCTRRCSVSAKLMFGRSGSTGQCVTMVMYCRYRMLRTDILLAAAALRRSCGELLGGELHEEVLVMRSWKFLATRDVGRGVRGGRPRGSAAC
jgi:hypothetical protein